MRLITERTEIAITINCRKMPVIQIDFADADEYGLVSKPVCIYHEFRFHGNKPHLIKAKLRAFCDEDKFKFSAGAIGIHSGFGYTDVKEMLDYNNSPIIHADEDVVIAMYDSKNKKAYAPMVLHTEKHVDDFCSTPLGFVDTDYSTRQYLALAGCELKSLHQ